MPILIKPNYVCANSNLQHSDSDFSRRSRVPLSSLPISFYRPPLSCLRITPSKKGSFCNLARSVPILASSTLGREKEIRKVTAPCRLSYSWCEREGAVPEFANLLSHMAASAVQPVDRRTAQEGCMERGAWSDGESGPARRHGRHRAHVVAVVGRSLVRTDPARAERGSGEDARTLS